FAVNEHLAALMEAQPQYDVSLEETHHIHKRDAPSGTAITLAEQILARLSRKSGWVEGQAKHPEELGIRSFREDEVPGTHLVRWSSPQDSIELKHIAHSREGFARGALLAARWLRGRRGCFGMRDLLGF
ncbi:MAG: 4-hydroxy-tetrahydrodipicolinate reductase, partial [Bacteroidetes bacterium]